jgi:hypothetical protein
VYERSSDRGQEQARHLLHELVNDLAAIQVRADILLSTTATTEAPPVSLMQADLAVLRAIAGHATTTAEQIALVIVEAEYPAIESRDA